MVFSLCIKWYVLLNENCLKYNDDEKKKDFFKIIVTFIFLLLRAPSNEIMYLGPFL